MTFTRPTHTSLPPYSSLHSSLRHSLRRLSDTPARPYSVRPNPALSRTSPLPLAVLSPSSLPTTTMPANPVTGAAVLQPIAPYPEPRFDPYDYYDPVCSQRIPDSTIQRPHSPNRRPPIIHLHWMWLLIRLIGLLLQIVNWFGRRLDAHKLRPVLKTLPVASYYDVGPTSEEMDDGMADSALRAILPGWIVSLAEFVDARVVMPLWSMLHSVHVFVVPSQWLGVTQRPALYMIYAMSTMVYGTMNLVLTFLTAMTGQKRSWVGAHRPHTDAAGLPTSRLLTAASLLCPSCVGQRV